MAFSENQLTKVCGLTDKLFEVSQETPEQFLEY